MLCFYATLLVLVASSKTIQLLCFVLVLGTGTGERREAKRKQARGVVLHALHVLLCCLRCNLLRHACCLYTVYAARVRVRSICAMFYCLRVPFPAVCTVSAAASRRHVGASLDLFTRKSPRSWGDLSEKRALSSQRARAPPFFCGWWVSGSIK